MEKDIIDLHKRWIEIEVADAEGVVQFCSDDFECMPISGEHIKGKREFSKWLRANKDGSKIESIEISNRQVSCLNHLGSLIADFKTTVRTEENKLQTILGQHFWHLKLVRGTWKVDKLTWKVNEIR